MEKVLCINASDRGDLDIFPNWIEEGKEYTIRRIENGMYGRKRVLLEEVKNPSVYFEELMGNAEPGFNLNRFVTLSKIEAEETAEEFMEY
jgi:hypothetical protein